MKEIGKKGSEAFVTIMTENNSSFNRIVSKYLLNIKNLRARHEQYLNFWPFCFSASLLGLVAPSFLGPF